jgi:hypothetical protein
VLIHHSRLICEEALGLESARADPRSCFLCDSSTVRLLTPVTAIVWTSRAGLKGTDGLPLGRWKRAYGMNIERKLAVTTIGKRDTKSRFLFEYEAKAFVQVAAP